MELLSVIRRWRYRDHYSIREISRRTGLSRNTVRKYLRSDSVEPKFNIPDRPSKLAWTPVLAEAAPKARSRAIEVQGHGPLCPLHVDFVENRVFRRPRYASAAAVSEAKPGISASRGEDRRRKGDELRHFPEVLGGGGQ
jgi:transcriptional regulator with XRE-family HTH domain